MIIAIDETGAFESISSGDFGVVTIVSITEKEIIKFSNYLNSIFPSGYKNIKGNNIQFSDREKIIKYCSRKQEIRFFATIFDVNVSSKEAVESHQNGIIGKIDESIVRYGTKLNPKLKQELLLFKSQIKNYKRPDYLKFLLITEGIRDWFQYFQFDYISTDIRNDDWKIKFRIDTQNAPVKFVGLIKTHLYLTGNSLSPTPTKIHCPKEWDESHPFFCNYNADEGLDMKKFFSEMEIVTEQEEIALFLPDLIGNTIFKSINNQRDTKWLKILSRLKSSRSWSIKHYDKSGYYIIYGFDSDTGRDKVHDKIKTHWRAMKKM